MKLPRTGMLGMFGIKNPLLLLLLSPSDQTLVGCKSFSSYTLKNTHLRHQTTQHTCSQLPCQLPDGPASTDPALVLTVP